MRNLFYSSRSCNGPSNSVISKKVSNEPFDGNKCS